MTWSYSGDPSASDNDAVRFLIGDTDTTDQQIQDEEIAWALSERGDQVYYGAARCAELLGAENAKLTTKSVGDLNIQYGQRADQFYSLASRLERMALSHHPPVPFAGGTSRADAIARDEDTDRVMPAMEKGMHDNPDVTYPDNDERDSIYYNHGN
tara:strand:+ start:2713 stop:3177 length:465 start_codon:yes stop_codon:yes gene_type:complete